MVMFCMPDFTLIAISSSSYDWERVRIRMQNGADMRIKRGADPGCFLCKLCLNLFRKHFIVLDKTEIRCDLSSDSDGSYEELPLVLLGFFPLELERGMRCMTLYMFSELF